MNAPTTSVPSWCPFATPTQSPNCTPGRAGFRAVVLHVTDGTFRSAINWLRNPASKASAHFVISRAGQIVQLVSLHDTAHANGLHWDAEWQRWLNARNRVVTPRWPLLTPPVNPNRQTISIEHEGTPRDAWTPAQRAASLRLLRWLARVTGLAYVPGETLIGHCDLDDVDRPNCPGPLVDIAQLAAEANGAPLPHPIAPRTTRYRVVTDGRSAIVRAQATTRSAILRSLRNGSHVEVVRVLRGGTHAGSNLWAELADSGFVWGGLLEEDAVAV